MIGDRQQKNYTINGRFNTGSETKYMGTIMMNSVKVAK